MVLRFYTKNFKSFRPKMKAWHWFSRLKMKSKFGKIAVTPSFLVEMTWNFLCRILEPLRKINYKIAIVKFCLYIVQNCNQSHANQRSNKHNVLRNFCFRFSLQILASDCCFRFLPFFSSSSSFSFIYPTVSSLVFISKIFCVMTSIFTAWEWIDTGTILGLYLDYFVTILGLFWDLSLSICLPSL